jgi:hypothetical protein
VALSAVVWALWAAAPAACAALFADWAALLAASAEAWACCAAALAAWAALFAWSALAWARCTESTLAQPLSTSPPIITAAMEFLVANLVIGLAFVGGPKGRDESRILLNAGQSQPVATGERRITHARLFRQRNALSHRAGLILGRSRRYLPLSLPKPRWKP